jgi:integrase/recombinase XerC
MSDTGLVLTPAELEARLQGFVREYLKDKSRETVGTYRRALNEFERYIASAEADFRFRPEDVEGYKAHLVTGRGLSEVSVSTYLTALRRFCEYLREIGLLRVNPASAVRGNRRPTEHSREVLSAAEVARLLDVLGEETLIDRRDRAVVHCMLFAGLSEIEITRASVQDLDHTLLGWNLNVQGKGRTSKDERVPLDKPVIGAIQSYLSLRRRLRPDEPLFASHGHRSEGQRLNTRSVRSRIRRLLELAEITRPGVTPHSLTHTAPLLWLEDGMSLEDVRRRMRHGTLDTTRIYERRRESVGG